MLSRRPSRQRISRFAVIGVFATLVYAACASALSHGGLGLAPLPAVQASLAGYLIAGMFSYAGHKYVTFASGGAHSVQIPRFLLLNAAGLALATALPSVMTGVMGLPAIMPIIITCIAVPVFNYVVLERWVFRDA